MAQAVSPSSRRPPTPLTSLSVVICYPRDRDLIEQLRNEYDIDITYFNIETEVPVAGTVYFLSDFECDEFKRLHALAEQTSLRFIGPAVLRSRISNQLTLYMPRPNRPRYSDIMEGAVVVLGKDVHERRNTVYLLQFMSAKVKKAYEASSTSDPDKTNILVTTTASGSAQYKLFSSLNLPIVKPDYIAHCWRNRDVLDFNAKDETLMKEYALGAFEGLSIVIVGFREKDVNEMTVDVIKNKGKIVESIAQAGFIVCNPSNPQDWENLQLRKDQKAVTDEWIWSSVHTGRCSNEDSYLVPIGLARRSIGSPLTGLTGSRRSKSSMNDLDRSNNSLLNATPDYVYSTDDLEALVSPKKLDRKQQVCQEMLETEHNYLNALEVLLKFRDVILSEVEIPGQENLIKKDDIQIIFGRLQPIVDCHKKIYETLKNMLDNWKPEHDIATIWIKSREEMARCYPPYINNYDTAKKVLETAYLNNSRFHSFVKTKESNPEFKRNSLTELLIRPVQRLPSVILLLKEIHKRSEKSHKDVNRRLEDAISVVNYVLEKANSVRAQADHTIAQLQRFTQVDDVPAHLVCSRRTMICELDGFAIAGTENWQLTERKHVRIILFNDVIVVCKIRNLDPSSSSTTSYAASPSGGTLSRMVRQSSFGNFLKHQQKPYKYLMHVPSSFIRTVRIVRREENGEPQSITSPDESPVYSFTIREATKDDLWIVQPSDDKKMQVVVDHIHQQAFMENFRSVKDMPVDVADMYLQYPEIKEPVERYLKKPPNWFVSLIRQLSSRISIDNKKRRQRKRERRNAYSHYTGYHSPRPPSSSFCSSSPPSSKGRYSEDSTQTSLGSSNFSSTTTSSAASPTSRKSYGLNQTISMASSSTMPRPPKSGFRRAISQAHMTVNRLTRMTGSRTNIMRDIQENSPNVDMNPGGGAEVETPKRGLRSRITSSTFVSTLRRRESIFRHSDRTSSSGVNTFMEENKENSATQRQSTTMF